MSEDAKPLDDCRSSSSALLSASPTPGPWQILGPISDGALQSVDVGVRNGPVVAQIFGGQREDQEHGANARLVAAAPDLLEAVEAMLEEYEEGRNIQPYEIREMCRRARARVYGQEYGG